MALFLPQVLNGLADTAIDVPKAPSQVGGFAGKLVAMGVLSLSALLEHIVKAGDGEEDEGEDAMLVDAGFAAPTAAAALAAFKVLRLLSKG